MKSKDNIQKDWQELLREKAGNVAGDQPQMSFAELKEKMMAAAAEAGAGAGASAGSDAAGLAAGAGASAVGDAAGLAAGAGASVSGGRRGLLWLKYAAAVAVIGAAGVMLLTDPWKGGKGGDLSNSTAENRTSDEVTVVETPGVEAMPVEEAMPVIDDSRDETIPVDLTKFTAGDAASSNAPSSSLAQRAGKASDHASKQHTSGITDNNRPDFDSTYTQSNHESGYFQASMPDSSTNQLAEVTPTQSVSAQDPTAMQLAEVSPTQSVSSADDTPKGETDKADNSSPATNNSPDFGSTDTHSGTGSGTEMHSGVDTRDAAEASNATQSGNTPAEVSATYGTSKQDPFTEPVKPLKKQLRRFSVGASGFLASNGIGSGKVRLNSMDYDMVTYTDNNGKLFYSYSAPSVRYNHSAPISGGISLRYNFTPVFYAESGLRLTYLHTWITPSGAAQNLLYAGIPLGVGANFAHLGNASFYASAYGMLSKCVMGHNNAGFPSNYSQLSDIPLMWSAGASLGASYNITRVFGLFAEPTVSYYFPTNNAPQTIYKENPWYFTLNLGIRFNLQ